MARLKIRDENGKERVVELKDAVTTIGRASSNTVQVTDEKSSRQHFKIEKDGARFKVIDLGSTNGTRLNGTRLAASTFLRTGDELALGKTTFRYEDPDEVPPPAPAAPKPEEKKPEEKKVDEKKAEPAAEKPTFDRTVELDPVPEPPPAPKKEEEKEGPKFVLKVLEGKNPGHVYEMGAKALTLGRHASNTIQIVDDAASNYHAEINREPIGWVLADLGSTNGTKVKQKGKNDFEKVVKTPLSPGMQIRVGKTLLEFQNIGAPVEDEALFGTISLDPDKLEAQLSGSKGPGKGPLLAVAAALLVIVGVVVWKMGAKPVDPTPPSAHGPDKPVAPTGNLVQNGDFQKVEPDGVPTFFQVNKSPDVRVALSPEADRRAAQGQTGLQISKGSSLRPAYVLTEPVQITPSAVYELAGALKNEGEGLFGLRVVWLKGNRVLAENPIVLAGTQNWQELKTQLTPPSWAERARVGVFVQGREGRSAFDDITFQQVSGASPQPPASVAFNGVSVAFEGGKGAFAASVGDETVIADGDLSLVTADGKAACDLASAFQAQARKEEGGAAGYGGKLYDFGQHAFNNFYQIQASPSATGVNLNIALDLPGETDSRPQLSFYVQPAVSGGDIEIARGGGPERLASTDNRTVSNAQALLFNAGQPRQLFVSFTSPKPVEVELHAEGKRRKVTVRFSGEVTLGLAPENVENRKRMLALAEEMRTAVSRKEWGVAETKMRDLVGQFGPRFPQAREEAATAERDIENAWSRAQDEINRDIDILKNQATPGADITAAVKNARDTVQRHIAAWTGSKDRVAELQKNMDRIEAIRASGENQKAEQEAQAALTRAENSFKSKNYQIAILTLKNKILNDPINSKTKVADKARELLPQWEKAYARQSELNAMTDALLEKVKNLREIKDFAGAVKAIETDKRYQDNKNDLPEIEKLLIELRQKK